MILMVEGFTIGEKVSWKLKKKLLMKSFCYKPCLVLVNASIWIFLYSENPLAANELPMRKNSSKSPSEILNKWIELNFDSFKPFMLSQGSLCGVRLWVNMEKVWFEFASFDSCKYKMIIDNKEMLWCWLRKQGDWVSLGWDVAWWDREEVMSTSWCDLWAKLFVD